MKKMKKIKKTADEIRRLEKDVEYYKEDRDDERDAKEAWVNAGIILMGLLVGAIILCIILGSKGMSLSGLDLDDELVIHHFLEYYPEYDNCTIKYWNSGAKEIKVYCDIPDKRDGIIPEKEFEPNYRFTVDVGWDELIVEYKNDMQECEMLRGYSK